MSVTITQHPSSISFAGNPVLLKAYSNLSEKTFLKVCAEVTVKIHRQDVLMGSFIHTLSIPTNGNQEEVVFDLSDILLSDLSQVVIDRGAYSGYQDVSISGGYAAYSVKVWDEYLDEYSEIISTKNVASSSSERKAIPGAYTDMQRLTLPEDTASYLGDARMLSNKPGGEAIPKGGKFVIPVFSKEEKEYRMGISNNETGTFTPGLFMLFGNECRFVNETIPEDTPSIVHSIEFLGSDLPPFFVHVVPEHPFARYFEFVNRLGAVESIYTFGRTQRKTNLTQERQVKRHNVSFRPSVRYVKRTLQEEQTLELSTGAISRMWAKWFVEEFLVAESAWMYDSRADDMIPVIIEADEAVSIYNESEAEVLDLPFKVTMCING